MTEAAIPASALLGLVIDGAGARVTTDMRPRVQASLHCGRTEWHLLAVVVPMAGRKWLASRTGYAKDNGWRATWLDEVSDVQTDDVNCPCDKPVHFEPHWLATQQGEVSSRDIPRDPDPAMRKLGSAFGARRGRDLGARSELDQFMNSGESRDS